MVPNGKKVKDQVFAFDRIFDDNATQADVYEGTTKSLLDCVLDGYNATVFAYGATGCGKTHTITGTSQQPGIIFLTMQELFEKIAERSDEKCTEVSLSYLEIYNETIRDLLVPGGSKQGLMLREDSHQTVTVAGLTSHHPKDVQEVMDMIVQGNEYRTVSPTEANATSSRSHAVLQINIAQRDKTSSVDEPHTMATLSIIDLAGSERASATKNRGDRLIEGANINKSLLALGSCINALCDARQRSHVPYRNSKLTRLLKFSLGGNCKTVMIVCVSPSSVHFDETQNTLRYANRAKNIQTKVTRNVFNVNRHVKDFLVKIDEQMAFIKELQAQQKDAENILFAKFRKQMEKRDAGAREGVLRLRAAYDNSIQERRDKIELMKKQKMIERRISLLTAWMASFETICAARGDEESMPENLKKMRNTAQGILVELENSRHHIRQKLEKTNWERAIDTALQHSIRQLPDGDVALEGGEVASLTREAELLKSNFARESYREVLEQEKSGDSAMFQVLLAAQFDTLASLSDLMAMGEDEAVAHAKGIITRLLEGGYSAVSHCVKPDGTLMPIEVFPPSRKGTPKKKRAPNLTRDSSATYIPSRPSFLSSSVTSAAPPPPAPLAAIQEQTFGFGSPAMKSSPRRPRKAPLRKGGVTFTPKKGGAGKRSPSKRSVRWRDDDEDGPGTLADFANTPQRFPDSTPLMPSMTAHAEANQRLQVVDEQAQDEANNADDDASPEPSILVAPHVPAYLNGGGGGGNDSADESSPTMVAQEPSSLSLPPVRLNRFQAGFLSKPLRGGALTDDVAVDIQSALPTQVYSADASSSDEGTPLRALNVLRASSNNALSPPQRPSPNVRPTNPVASTLGGEENHPPASSSFLNPAVGNESLAGSTGASDSESNVPNISNATAPPSVDAVKLRAALHATAAAKRAAGSVVGVGGRIGSMSGTAASNAKRVSVVLASSVGGGVGGGVSTPSTTTAISGGLAASVNSNGVSRPSSSSSHPHHLQRSRRNSPPISCGSPPAPTDTTATGLPRVSVGQARRMHLGGSLRWDGGSPSKAPPGQAIGGPAGDAAKGRRMTIAAAVTSAGIGQSRTTATSGVGLKDAPAIPVRELRERQSVVRR